MKLRLCTTPRFTSECGVSLLELLVSVGIASSLLVAAMSQFRLTTVYSYDNETISRAEETVRTLLDTISYDLRMLGSGMPLEQPNFQPAGAGLADSPLAVLLNSDATMVNFRFNPKGRNAVLTADYTPLPTDLTLLLSDTSDLVAGDVIYISNMLTGGEEGMEAEITTVMANSVTIDSSYVTSAGATFDAGSSVTRISQVTYQYDAGAGTIARTDEAGTVNLSNNATVSFDYLDTSVNSIALPLTNAVVSDDLAAVQVVISVQGEKTLIDGSTYTAQAEQVIALRNLNLSR